MNKVYSEAIKQYIREHAATTKDEILTKEISSMLKRPINIQSIRKLRQQLGILKASGRGYCKIKGTENDNTQKLGDTQLSI